MNDNPLELTADLVGGADAPTTAGPDIDDAQLPDKDDAIANNYQEHPQSALLTTSLTPRLLQIQPDGQFSIGEDCGIYYRYAMPFLSGCRSPDWSCVLGVPPTLNGRIRRSYVLWNELVRPLLLVEYVSGDGREERDRTPHTGKFWIYENAIAAGYYAIFDGFRATLEVHRLENGVYVPVPANASGRVPISPLGIELGLWHAEFRSQPGWWLRAWDIDTGLMLPSVEEREQRLGQQVDQIAEQAVLARDRADKARSRAQVAEELLDETRELLLEETERAESERHRAEAASAAFQHLRERLRAAGIDPDAL